MEKIASSALPVIIGIILIYGFIKGVDVFDTFVDGAKNGLTTTGKILPTLIGLIIAVNMLRASGLLDAVCNVLAPLAQSIGAPGELVPLALLRPVSGGGASAYAYTILKEYGPDSIIGKMASVLTSASETTFYAIAVYFGATRYKKLAYTVPAALLGDLTVFFISIIAVKHL